MSAHYLQEKALRTEEPSSTGDTKPGEKVDQAVAPIIRAGSSQGRYAAANAERQSLIQSARMNGHDPHAHLKDVLTRLPTQKASELDQFSPHQWMLG
ncbi:Transposase, IS66 family [Pseudomonas savastanoi]|uniref:Transposase, IS66 family n=1 Tax=Pseudomonas savastanoi TaxID=29438 RepID=A0A3M5GFT6_PSESS|nr:Transposase, IS66 family [Pseudomonas savastanoi]